jgi:hypothetical protein
MRHPAPLCQLWELQEGGRYDIDDLLYMHEMMDVEDENLSRLNERPPDKPRGNRRSR